MGLSAWAPVGAQDEVKDAQRVANVHRGFYLYLYNYICLKSCDHICVKNHDDIRFKSYIMVVCDLEKER